MPVHKIIKNKDGCMAVWHIQESVEEFLKLIQLNEEDRLKCNSFKLDKRKQEWLASRVLLQHVLGQYPAITYNENGKPFLANSNQHISISHTNGYAAICLSKHPTALDIEICSARIEKVSSRFVHPEERHYITDDERLNFLTNIWCTKESLYKYFDETGVIFNEHFYVHPFDIDPKGTLKANCCYKDIDKTLLFNFEITNNYTLVYHI